jgi:hypothetical protein
MNNKSDFKKGDLIKTAVLGDCMRIGIIVGFRELKNTQDYPWKVYITRSDCETTWCNAPEMRKLSK